MLTRFLRDTSGATAIEYSLIATLISLVMLPALIAVGQQLSATFNTIADTLRSAHNGY